MRFGRITTRRLRLVICSVGDVHYHLETAFGVQVVLYAVRVWGGRICDIPESR